MGYNGFNLAIASMMGAMLWTGGFRPSSSQPRRAVDSPGRRGDVPNPIGRLLPWRSDATLHKVLRSRA